MQLQWSLLMGDGHNAVFLAVSKNNIRVFPILYWISWISRIRWIKLELVKHDWKVAFLCLPLTADSPGVMVVTPDWESVGWGFKYRIFSFVKEKPCLISLILNTK